MDTIFKGIFDNELIQTIAVSDFLLCLGVSLVLGLIMAAAYIYMKNAFRPVESGYV